MIGQLKVRQCNRTCDAGPIMRFIVRMLVRVRGGIYTCTCHARFRRFSIEIVEKQIAPKKITKATPKIKVKCDLKQISLFSVYCVRELFAPAHSLFLSVNGLRLGKFQCIILSLFYHNIVEAKLRRAKLVGRSKNVTGRK